MVCSVEKQTLNASRRTAVHSVKLAAIAIRTVLLRNSPHNELGHAIAADILEKISYLARCFLIAQADLIRYPVMKLLQCRMINLLIVNTVRVRQWPLNIPSKLRLPYTKGSCHEAQKKE